VLSKLRSALTAEGLPEDAMQRVMGAVQEAFEEEEVELLPEPSSKAHEFVDDTSPLTEDESPTAPTEAPAAAEDPTSEAEALVEHVEPEPSTRPPSSAFL
ncbi:unnamed protein product, partial [Symbiodinium pilosum]